MEGRSLGGFLRDVLIPSLQYGVLDLTYLLFSRTQLSLSVVSFLNSSSLASVTKIPWAASCLLPEK